MAVFMVIRKNNYNRNRCEIYTYIYIYEQRNICINGSGGARYCATYLLTAIVCARNDKPRSTDMENEKVSFNV